MRLYLAQPISAIVTSDALHVERVYSTGFYISIDITATVNTKVMFFSITKLKLA